MEAHLALMKPGFYMLAKHGPWNHHVRVKDITSSNQAEAWLVANGHRYRDDFETLIENIEHKATKKTSVPVTMTRPSGRTTTVNRAVQSVEPIMFFNDPSLASYVKLTWG